MIQEIYFDDRTNDGIAPIVAEYVQKSVTAALSGFQFEVGWQVSVSFVEESEIQELNREYRKVDRVTDVLSFPLGERDGRAVELLGDIVICTNRAMVQAEEFGHSFEREVCYLSVHSALHLMGFDHEEDDEKGEMRKLEKEIMAELKIFKNEDAKPTDRSEELIKLAVQMKEKAYCPYSNYQVGAALLTAGGKLFGGCNVENASYPAGICAERTAAAKAVSEGETRFCAIAIAVSGDKFGYPCGVCRQFLCEFAEEDMIVYLINSKLEVRTEKFSEVFPHGFRGSDMEAEE